MRYFVFLSLVFSTFSFAALASSTELPKAEVSSKILGGTLLMIQMKYSLAVNADTQMQIVQEIGKSKCENLFHDVIMAKSPAYLRAKYLVEYKVATRSLIDQYESLLASKNIALK